MIEFKDLTNDEKYHIAEYNFAYHCDTLIKTEVAAMLAVIISKSEIKESDVTSLSVSVANTLLNKVISTETLNKIMKEYTSGKLG